SLQSSLGHHRPNDSHPLSGLQPHHVVAGEKALLQTGSERDPDATCAVPRELLHESLLLQKAAVKNTAGPRIAEPGTRLRRDAARYRDSLPHAVECRGAIASSDERVRCPSPLSA